MGLSALTFGLFVQSYPDDMAGDVPQNRNVTEKPKSDWYLREWLSHFGKRQSSLSAELGWTKGRAYYVWHSETPYQRDVVNEIATWLNLEPFELLIPPSRALALRRMRQSAAMIVAEDEIPFDRTIGPSDAEARQPAKKEKLR